MLIRLNGATVASLVFACSSMVRGEAPPVTLDKLPPAAATSVDFAEQIRPLLASACYECHGPDAQEAGLRLDIRKKALVGGDSGPAFIPGKSAESRLIQLVAGLDETTGRMPPEDSGEALSPEQIGILRTWIDAGAKWPETADGTDTKSKSTHWSFQQIKRVEPPSVTKRAWVRNPIDAFILAKLETESVQPSPEADRAMLLRRVYIDLIGLPPTAQEVDKFLGDRRDDAYERVVDKLLNSPHYGERCARHWLDAARYADQGNRMSAGRFNCCMSDELGKGLLARLAKNGSLAMEWNGWLWLLWNGFGITLKKLPIRVSIAAPTIR